MCPVLRNVMLHGCLLQSVVCCCSLVSDFPEIMRYMLWSFGGRNRERLVVIRIPLLRTTDNLTHTHECKHMHARTHKHT